nr:hypothetical protein CFP56_32429 [Quercus suber]
MAMREEGRCTARSDACVDRVTSAHVMKIGLQVITTSHSRPPTTICTITTSLNCATSRVRINPVPDPIEILHYATAFDVLGLPEDEKGIPPPITIILAAQLSTPP